MLVTGALETAVLLAVGTTLYRVDLPASATRWFDFAWIFVLGLTACALLGISALFPLKWMCQGLRGVFLPDSARVVEQTGDWEFGRVALVLAAWCVGGLVLYLLTFRWKSRRNG